ncbi:hypothetical protein Taro_001032 [Colocasia esculenta]|uniref:Uncharacterized protein n=1 Tax=Colocasia esculenta TaxID=4460 RepID=A0A843TI52_COLES|nr:hypothetical protein [Colocasia esculenta]
MAAVRGGPITPGSSSCPYRLCLCLAAGVAFCEQQEALYRDCNSACAGRCRLASRYKICIRACGTCCHRCKCVPPGTSGNREACGPCYANMPTHGGRLKCP